MGKPIPKNATLQFDWVLIFIEKEKDNNSTTIQNGNTTNTNNDPTPQQQEEIIERALKNKTKGNEHYAAKEYDKAFIFYQKSLKEFPTTFGEGLCEIFFILCLFVSFIYLSVFFSDEISKRMKEIRIASLSNLSQTSLFLNMLNAAVVTSSKALELDPKNTKCLFRKGKALQLQKSYDGMKNTQTQTLRFII